MPEALASESALAIERLLRARRTVRAFKPDPVPRQVVQRLLELAATAPSNSNTQPWRVYALAGGALAVLSAELVGAFERDEMPPYSHFPQPLPQPYCGRQEDFGARYYGALGIDRANLAARQRQAQKNYLFFGAPVGLIFTVDQRLKSHSWLDLGLFMQNLMIGAQAHGLATCPQVSFARVHPILARHLPMGEHETTVCGMSLGHAAEQEPVNHMGMPREPVEAFARLIGFEGG